MESMIGMENLPDETLLKILDYLSLGQLILCARVSKRLNNICKDSSLGFRSSTLVMKKLTVKFRISIIDILIARSEVTEVIMKNPSNSSKTKKNNYCDYQTVALHFMISGNKLYLHGSPYCGFLNGTAPKGNYLTAL